MALSLSIQTATLYASGESSTFTGTGGPWGFSPYTGQFGGVVSSAGLAGEPFDDTVYDVATGDEVIFVAAVQNFTGGTRVFDLGLRADLPSGFTAPEDGINLTVTDGAGNDLAFTGDLFGAGLRLSGPVAPYDADSGANVVLVTYSLVAAATLPGPYARVLSAAAITHAALAAGGTDQGVVGSAKTTVVTAAPMPLVQPESSPAAVARGQSIAFDVSVAIPAGTLRDVRLDTVLPAGAAQLKLVSAAVTGIGTGLQASAPTIGTDGSVRFATINSNGNPGSNVVSLRVIVQADGTASGDALLQTVLSSANNNGSAGRWSATVASSVGVIVPPGAPLISGTWLGQQAGPGALVHPLANLSFANADPAATGSVAVSVRDGTLGRLTSTDPGASFNQGGSTFFMSGSFAALQEAVRQLQFRATTVGTEQFTVTLLDARGGIAQNDTVTLSSTPGAADPVVIGQGSGLSAVDLSGTYVLRGQGASLLADGVSGRPLVTGFGARDRLVLPGTTTAFTYTPETGILSTGASTVTLAGRYDPARFTATDAGGGRVTVTFAPDPLFDGDDYLARNADVAADGTDPYQHFLAIGSGEGRDPSAFFSISYYLSHNPDVRDAGIDALQHFEASGFREGRDPSALFSLRDYLDANPDVRGAGVNPLLHYVTSGRVEGRAAFAVTAVPQDPLVDARSYYAHNPEVRAAGVNATAHYLSAGWREGRNPNDYFDTNYYLTANPDVRNAGINPLQHFEASGAAEGRQPSLLFDDGKYLAANPDVRAAGVNPLLHFITAGQAEGRSSFLTGGTAPADPLVQAAFYDRQLGATLIPGGAAGAAQAAWSYDTIGWQRGLDPDPFFDTNYYLGHNPDIAAAHVNPLAHYEAFGWQEGRNPAASFSTNRYLAANPDVAAAGVNPLLHYVENGQAEGRPIYPV